MSGKYFRPGRIRPAADGAVPGRQQRHGAGGHPGPVPGPMEDRVLDTAAWRVFADFGWVVPSRPGPQRESAGVQTCKPFDGDCEEEEGKS